MLKYYKENINRAGTGLECLPGVKQLLQALKVHMHMSWQHYVRHAILSSSAGCSINPMTLMTLSNNSACTAPIKWPLWSCTTAMLAWMQHMHLHQRTKRCPVCRIGVMSSHVWSLATLSQSGGLKWTHWASNTCLLSPTLAALAVTIATQRIQSKAGRTEQSLSRFLHRKHTKYSQVTQLQHRFSFSACTDIASKIVHCLRTAAV